MLGAGYNGVAEAGVERKFRNMKNRYKTIKDNKRNTGRGEVKWENCTQMQQLFHNDQTINIPMQFLPLKIHTPTQQLLAHKPPLADIAQENNITTEEFSTLTESSANLSIPLEVLTTSPTTVDLLSPSVSNLSSPPLQSTNQSKISQKEKAQRGKQLYGMRKKTAGAGGENNSKVKNTQRSC